MLLLQLRGADLCGGETPGVGHVKLLLTAGDGHCIGNFTDDKSAPSLQGRIDGSPDEANLTLNARVEMTPQELEQIVRDTVTKDAAQRVRATINDLRCLRPGRPKPTHRYDTIIE